MPKKLFYNLTEEKQAIIVKAAFEEFLNHIYADSSINRIVLSAQISRGSFYLYFEDKLDIYLFTTGKILETQSSKFLSVVTEQENMNLFTFFKALFLFNIELLSDSEYSQYFKNLYLGMNYDIWLYLRSKQREIKEEVLNQLVFEKTIDTSNDYIEALTSILEMINREMITKKIFEDLSGNNILKLYEARIQLINKEGAKKHE